MTLKFDHDVTEDWLGRYIRPTGQTSAQRVKGVRLPNLMAGPNPARGKVGSRYSSEYRRRAIVRTQYHHVQYPGGYRALHNYVHYIQRESSGIDKTHTTMFNADVDFTGKLDAHREVRKWKHDDHCFFPVISPNDGHYIGVREVAAAKRDSETPLTAEQVTIIREKAFRDFVREVMKDIEDHLDTKLVWIAGVHEAPDAAHPVNRHAHVMIRGLDQDGRPLRIKPRSLEVEFSRIAEEIMTNRFGMMSHGEYKALKSRQEPKALTDQDVERVRGSRLRVFTPKNDLVNEKTVQRTKAR